MDTSWSVSCHAPKGATAAIKPLIHATIQHTIALFSPWVGDSEISRLNAAPSDRVALSADFARFLAEMLEIARISDGAFDPTLGALVDLRGFGPPGPRPADAPIPQTGGIATTRAVSGWRQLALDTARGCLTRPRGMKLDFGGCAKGWAADRISDGLAGLGIAYGRDRRRDRGARAEARPAALVDRRRAARNRFRGAAAGGAGRSGDGKQRRLPPPLRPYHRRRHRLAGRERHRLGHGAGTERGQAVAARCSSCAWRRCNICRIGARATSRWSRSRCPTAPVSGANIRWPRCRRTDRPN